MSFLVEVWSQGALFARPEMKVERVSYEVPTVSAMSGLMKSVYWHPGVEYEIDRIAVMNPIRHMPLCRNEVDTPIVSRSAMNGTDWLDADAHSVQRSADCLKDVRYVIETRPVPDPTNRHDVDWGKTLSIIDRRLRHGQCFRQPCLGCREFPASFGKWDGPFPQSTGAGDMTPGWMFYRFDYTDPQHPRPRFANVSMNDGIIDLRDVEVKG
jgi:CRISPR-associated protein Cas5d